MRREKRMLVAEVLIHHLDTLRMLLGPLRVTSAGLSRSYSEQLAGEDGAVIQMKADGGGTVTVFASFAAHGFPAVQVDRLDLLGDKGSIRLDGALLTCSGETPEERRLRSRRRISGLLQPDHRAFRPIIARRHAVRDRAGG